jgi:hypothetical protein
MPTTIRGGVYQPPFTEGDDQTEHFEIYIDDAVMQLSESGKFIGQITYEELRGIMAIMAAEQEKTHLMIKAQIKSN